MATHTLIKLSGCTDGRSVKVAAIATPGTLIHTAHATSLDQIWLWASNTDGTDRKLTIEFGGVASPDDLIEKTIPAESGPKLIIPGWVLTNSLIVRAFAASANLILLTGKVIRVT